MGVLMNTVCSYIVEWNVFHTWNICIIQWTNIFKWPIHGIIKSSMGKRSKVGPMYFIFLFFIFFSNICLQFILDFLNNIHICKQQDVGFSPNPQFLTSVCSHTLARTAICFLVAKPCPALLYSMDGCTLDSPWDFPSKDTGVGCHFLLQGQCILT